MALRWLCGDLCVALLRFREVAGSLEAALTRGLEEAPGDLLDLEQQVPLATPSLS